MTEEDAKRYEVAYIASPEPEIDPDVAAYNECKITIHMAEEMLAKMRWHLEAIERRIKDKRRNKPTSY